MKVDALTQWEDLNLPDQFNHPNVSVFLEGAQGSCNSQQTLSQGSTFTHSQKLTMRLLNRATQLIGYYSRYDSVIASKSNLYLLFVF